MSPSKSSRQERAQVDNGCSISFPFCPSAFPNSCSNGSNTRLDDEVRSLPALMVESPTAHVRARPKSKLEASLRSQPTSMSSHGSGRAYERDVRTLAPSPETALPVDNAGVTGVGGSHSDIGGGEFWAEGERRVERVSNLEQAVKAGDVFLFRCRGVLSRLQRWLSRSEWDHVGVVREGCLVVFFLKLEWSVHRTSISCCSLATFAPLSPPSLLSAGLMKDRSFHIELSVPRVQHHQV